MLSRNQSSRRNTMNLTSARKLARFAAIASITMGILIIVGMGVAFALYGESLNRQAQLEPNAAYLIKAIKACAFRLCPALAVILVTSGGSTLYLLKKEKEQASTAKI